MRSLLLVVAPLVGLVIALAYLLVTTYRGQGSSGHSGRSDKGQSDPLEQVFSPRELRRLNAELERVAAEERVRLAHDVDRYIAGEVGHVVIVSDQPRDVLVLMLSDGRLLTLNGVSRVARGLLLHRVANDRLRPSGVDSNVFSCHLRLRGDSGREMTVSTRTVSLTQ
jgi:hypothetical protein